MALNMYVGVQHYVHLKSPLSLDIYANKNWNWMLCLFGNCLSAELASLIVSRHGTETTTLRHCAETTTLKPSGLTQLSRSNSHTFQFESTKKSSNWWCLILNNSLYIEYGFPLNALSFHKISWPYLFLGNLCKHANSKSGRNASKSVDDLVSFWWCCAIRDTTSTSSGSHLN